MRVSLIILFLVNSLFCFAQKDKSFPYDSINKPESIPVQLGLTSYKIDNTEDTNFDTSNFEIRIWKNDTFIEKVKLWQISKRQSKFTFKEYCYSITAIYYANNRIVYDQYDSLLHMRLPVIEGNKLLIGFLIDDLNTLQKDETAEQTYKGLGNNKLMQLNLLRFNVSDTVTINGETEIFKDGTIFMLGKDYTVELISKDYYLKYNFPAPEYYNDLINKSTGLFYANEIVNLINEK